MKKIRLENVDRSGLHDLFEGIFPPPYGRNLDALHDILSCLNEPLTVEVNELAGEVLDLKSELDVKNDLRVIRDVATEEFGMVEEKYVKMQYLSMGSGDSIEVFEEKKQETVGISAILSAIGLK